MKIRVGYELIYDFPQPTPMIMVLGTHFTPGVRRHRARSSDHQPVRADLALSRRLRQLVQPHRRAAGRMRLSADGVVRDSGLPDVVAPAAAAARGRGSAGGDADLSPRQPLLRDRPPVRDRLEAVRQVATGLGARPGDLRFRPSPHHLRLRACARDHDGLGGLQRRQGRVPRLRAPRHRLLPLHEHSGALLHRLSRRHRRAAALWPDGFRRLVRGLSRRALVHLRSAQQHPADRPRADRAWAATRPTCRSPTPSGPTRWSASRSGPTRSASPRLPAWRHCGLDAVLRGMLPGHCGAPRRRLLGANGAQIRRSSARSRRPSTPIGIVSQRRVALRERKMGSQKLKIVP